MTIRAVRQSLLEEILELLLAYDVADLEELPEELELNYRARLEELGYDPRSVCVIEGA